MNSSLLITAGIGSAAMLNSTATAMAAKTVKAPNIVYILADDWGYGDVSCLNPESKLKTTHTDKLAKEGMIFTNAHSSSAVSTPSRYSIITGRYNWRSKLKRGVLNGFSPALIEKNRETTATLLKSKGYHTACIGKWHLGWNWSKTGNKVDFTKPVTNGPDANGFDYYYSHCGSLDMAPYVYVENGKATAQPDRITVGKGFGFWRKGQTGADFVHEDVLPNFTRRAVKYISEQAKTDKPFFLYLPLPAPHTPILPTKEFQGKSGTNPYGDFVLQVDWSIGQVAKALKDSGVEDNTLIVVTSDNGCSPQANFNQLKKAGHNPNYKFRGHKADIYEGGHRIPFICRWPDVIKAGSKYNQQACQVDLMATCADILGVKLPDTAAEDSLSLLPAFQGKTMDYKKRSAVIHHSINGSFAVRKDNWKLILCPGSGGWSNPKPAQAKKAGLPAIQLYNLSSDIGEQKNVYKENQQVVKELLSLVEKYVNEGRSTPGMKQQNSGKTNFLPKGYEEIKKELSL